MICALIYDLCILCILIPILNAVCLPVVSHVMCFCYFADLCQENEAHVADMLSARSDSHPPVGTHWFPESQPQVETHWFSESGVIDLFLMLGPTVNNVFYQYRQLTGSTPLPSVYTCICRHTGWPKVYVYIQGGPKM